MNNYKIASVISFCTNDYKFLNHCIKSIKPFSSEIIVPVCDHFYDGRSENLELITKSRDENLDAKFVMFEYDVDYYKNLNLKRLTDPFQQNKHFIDVEVGDAWFWNQVARLYGYNQISSDCDYVLFIDCDEIFDTGRFIDWLNLGQYKNFVSMLFDCYFYFRETKYQSIQTEDANALCLVNRHSLDDEHFFLHSSERYNFINFPSGNKCRKVVGIDGKPMVHHYSWVRTRDEMMRKVKSWSHNRDRNWTELVESEFNRNFNPISDVDFIHKYSYKEVEPYIIL